MCCHAGLQDKGHEVDELAVYRTVPVEPDAAMVEHVRRGDVDAITFTSSSTVENFCAAVGTPQPQPLVISIGPITSKTAEERGLRVDAEADPHTIDGVVAALGACPAIENCKQGRLRFVIRVWRRVSWRNGNRR